MNEKWRDIRGFEGRYQVSNLGRVKSLPRVLQGYTGNKYNEKIMKPLNGDCRYYQVSLWRENKDSKRYIHRLVAEAFIENKDSKPQVNHIDGNRLNNCVDNLEWVTASENIRHAHAAGLLVDGRPKLSDSDVREAWVLYEDGVAKHKIAAKFGVNPSAIHQLINRKTYKSVEVPA